MSNGLTSLIDKLSKSAADQIQNAIKDRLQNLLSFLRDKGEIRIYIRNSQQFGHQSSSVNILRNLIRMGAKGPFTIVLDARDVMDYNNLESKIRLLIPQYLENDKEFTIAGILVAVTRIKPFPKLAALAITGGCDLGYDQVNFESLNVTGYIQLQPYAWTKGNYFFIVKPSDGAPYVIDLKDLYPAMEIVERAFYLPDPIVTEEDFLAIAGSKFKDAGEIFNIVMKKVSSHEFDLCPVYGISTPHRGDELTSLLNVIAGVIIGRETKGDEQKPTIIFQMSDLKLTTKKIINLLSLNIGLEDPLGFEASAAFKKWWFEKYENNNIILVENVPDKVQKAIDEADKTSILIINCPSVPTVMFNYLYANATLPPVLEGQNTVELMVNLGRPYIKITTGDDSLYSYPTLPLHSKTPGSIPNKLLSIVKDGVVLSVPKYWNSEIGSKTFPPTILPPIYQAYFEENEMSAYFEGLRDFYHDELNDKLLRALDLYVNWYAPDSGMSLSPEVRESPLEDLYDKLNAAIRSDESLDLLSVVTTTLINEFFKTVVTDNVFKITNATISISEDKSSVTLDGATSALGVSTASLNFTFKTSGKDIACEFKASLTGATLEMPGAQWLKVGDPELSIKLDSNSPVSVVATMGMNVKAGFESRMSIQIPTKLDQLLFQAEFKDPKPSLANIFQLVGGINLESLLPPQLLLGASIELQELSLAYNYKANVMEYIGMNVGTPPDKTWDLAPAIMIKGISLSILVSEPGDIKARKTTFDINGSFLIANSDVSVNISLPQLRIVGGLSEGSTGLSLTDVIVAYLGQAYTEVLPSFIKSTNIEKLSFFLDKALDSYSFSMGIKTDWPIDIASVPVFLITGLEFEINAISKNIDPPKAEKKNEINTNKTTEVTGSFSGSMVILPKSAKIELIVSATYGGTVKGWTFSAQQTSGVVSIGDLLKEYLGWDTGQTLGIDGLGITIETKTNSYEFTAKTAEPWKIPFPVEELTISGKVKIGHKNGTSSIGPGVRKSKAEMPVLILDESEGNVKALPITETTSISYGEISAEISWNNIDLLLTYEFNSDEKKSIYKITWGNITGDYDSTTKTAKLKFVNSTTLGSMVEIMVSWATGSKFSLSSPWNLLDKIPLSNFELVYNFSDGTVALNLNIGPIDLGFATINSIGLSYDKDPEDAKRKRVMINLDADFIFGGKIPAWDATKPETTPAPEGSGNKYLDLRLLAMGQHITFTGFNDAQTVQKAIALMAEMPEPKADTIPSVTFAADSSWLFAADFGVLRIDDYKNKSDSLALKLNEEKKAQYVLTLQAIFNDPNLYALRIALEGNAAKLFKGLDFQIMYRKLSDDLGVYKTEITLPDLMRHMTVGAYSITLPVFGIEVYTNGDFMVDIGFPWNENFDRSFTIEAIVPPGIPLLGAGGIYIGKIPQVVANVPAATNGLFNPILVMGFGARLGLGKSIEYGILKAGFSLTVFGILEGLLAKWNPYDATSTGGGGPLDIQGEYFFRLKGTFGLIGNIYGSVDFIVIKADVNLTVKVYAQITFASYEPIPITVLASVEATASITVDLWLFSFTISFSFSIGIKETFVIGPLQDPSQAPWKVGSQSSFGRLSSPLSTRLRDHGLALNGRTLQTITPNWSRLSKPASTAKLEGFLAYALTVAGDEAFANGNTPNKSKQLPCYITSLYIKSIPPASEHDHSSVLKAIGEAEDSSFETLAKMVTRWSVASIQPADVTPEEVDGIVISAEEIDALLNYLKGTKEMPMPIPTERIDSFLTDQIQFNLSMPNSSSSEKINAAFFPMALPLSFERPAYGDSPALNYTFADYNELAPDFISWLRDYFNQLAVQVQQESGDHDSFYHMLLEEKASVAEFVFSDYFLLIMRQMLQALGDGLRTFKYQIDPSMKTDDIVAWVNKKGHNFTPAFELNDLFEGNADHPLNTKVLTLPGVTYSVVSGDSFTSIAANAKFGSSFDAKALANLNAEKAGILNTGQKITYPEKPDYIIEGSMTLKPIAEIKFGIPLEDFLNNSNILTGENLLVSFATIALPPFHYQIQQDDTLNSIASAHGININTLGIPENGNLADLFSISDPYLNLVHLPQFEVGELIKEAQRVKALEQLSGMVSRYYLHGLRLPTEKISPVKEGMWVTKNPAGELVLPEFAGLFALTGQQFGIPELNIDPLTITLTRPDSLTWLTFAGDVKSFSYTISPGDENEKRIQALRKYATQNALDTSLLSIGSQSMVESDLSMYPLSSSIPCQTTASIDYPIGGKLGSDSPPRLWYLPGTMLTLPPLDGTGDESCPAFNLQLHRYNEATGATDNSEIRHYGWATAIEFTIKKLPKEEGDTAYNNTYEIMGASGKAAVLLERMVQTKLNETCSLMTLAYAVNQSGSDSALRIAAGSAITMGLSQANLSTTTRPPTMVNIELIGDETEKINLLNTNLEFVRLLWEASITRAGGFYLYFNEKNVGGLPDVIFNDKGEANVTLLVMYNDSIKTLRSYMNAALIGDPISSSSGAVLAQVVSKQVNHLVDFGESAASITAKYYSTILSLVQNNPTLEFSVNAVYTLVNASYLVSVGGSNPGGGLAAIATYFDMNPSDIKLANPRITEQMWSSALPVNTAIRLPSVSRTVGVSPGGTTLQEIATFYNTSAAAILGENRGTPNLMKEGQILSISTGPYSLSGGGTPGVQAIGATRLSLPAMPPITDPDYAKDYLLYLYTMLGYRVMDNQDFIASNVGLPLGPKGKPGSESWDKIRFVKPMSETETMEYSKGLPYLNLISDGKGMPEPITNSFQSIGRLLQIDYSWNDIYGNRLVTQLDEGTPIGGKNPKMPILTGYTAALLGLSQWPGISSYWTVAKAEDTKNFLLQTTMSFDPSPYNKPTGTDSEAWITRAKSAQVTYEKMLEQLTDPNGISIQFKTSLLTQPVAILAADVSTLIVWLIEIKRFISDRSEGNSTAPEPSEKTFTLSGTSSKTDLNRAQIFALDFELIINRLGIAQDDFAALPGIRQIATQITPKTILADINDQENKPGLDQFAKDIEETLSETGKFILTIATGENRLKNDTGGTNATVWGLRLGETTGNPIFFSITQAPQIFAPRPVSNKLESKSNITLFDYSKIDDFDPATNELIGTANTLTFSDIDLDLWVSQLFTSVDNLLSPEYLSSILIIDNTSDTHPIGITSFVESFIAQKKALANVAKKLISPVYKVQDISHIDSAQEALYQQLLNNLSSFYSTRAAVSFSSEVNADESFVSPRLFGNIVFNQQKEINSKVVLTASKLELKLGEQALTFLVEAPALLKSDNSGVLPSLPLDISFNGTSFEHQIADVPNIADYKASTWLSIVRTETAGKLNANLGKFEIPMFIRAFPTTPRMDNQSGVAFAKIPHSLNDLISWNYSFTYSQDYHYAQDRVYGEIEYNLKSLYGEEHSTLVDAFMQLAQFITAKSNLEKLLKETVPGISAKTDDPEKFRKAGKVLGAYLKMLTDITNASTNGSFFNNQTLLTLSGDENLKYAFHIEEGEYDVKDGEELEKAWVVKIVSADGAPPSGLLERPYIDIPNKGSQEQVFKRNEIPDNDPIVGTNWSKGIYAYWYASDDKKPINGDIAQAIGNRTMYIPGMNILERQDAKSTIYLKRNEELVKDKPSADDFIYQTPSVSFTNPLLPTIDQVGAYNIFQGGDAKLLAEILSLFFTELFKKCVGETQIIQLECQYAYSLVDELDPISLPVLLLPPKSVNPKTDFIVSAGGCALVDGPFVCDLSRSILNWLSENEPSKSKGELHFNLTIMSDQTEQLMPLIRLRNLFLEMKDLIGY